METQQEQSQQQQQQQQQQKEDGGSGKGSLVCRQSSTRWSPTSDQIRILKELYYNNGVRSPSAEQIQRISASLRQYGKIEGKNVFYWFQNHKARERQKKRFTTTSDMPMQKCIGNINGGDWKPDHQDYYYSTHNYPNITPGVSSASPSSSGVLGVGYGSVTMEKSFRDCSISAGGGSKCVGGSINQSLGWVSADHPYVSFNSLRREKSAIDESLGEKQQEEEEGPEIETLPLFPIHGEDINGFCNIKPNSDSYYYTGNWYRQAHNGKASSRTSLELSLNSYTAISPDSI